MANPNYCHRVTADDGAVGEQHLRDFQDNDKTIPTVLTTSQKLSTGVDARNVRHIVQMRPIRSMIEFKQIIGRGTRTYDGKDFFTIWDFVKAHENFNDPEWDGEPLAPEPPKGTRPAPSGPEPGPGGDPPEPQGGGPKEPPQQKLEVRLSDGTIRKIKYIASTTYWGPDGKPMSAAEFLERLFGDLTGFIADEDQLRTIWSDPDNRERFLGRLIDRGYDHERLDNIRRLVDAPDSDLFDVPSYVLFNIPPKTRHNRADGVRSSGLASTDQEMRDLLLSILSAYEELGEAELATRKLGSFLTARFGSVNEGKAKLGGISTVRDAFRQLQSVLYSG